MTTSDTIQGFDGLLHAIAHCYYAPGLDHDDLVQEARIGAWEALQHHSDARGTLASFIGLCAERKVQTAVRTALRLKHRPVNDAITTVADRDGQEADVLTLLPGGDRHTPDWTFELIEDLEGLRRDMHELLSGFEAVCVVGVARGDSYEAIAADRGATVGQVDRALTRARWKFRGEGPPSAPEVGHVRRRPWVAGSCGRDCPTCGLLNEFATTPAKVAA